MILSKRQSGSIAGILTSNEALVREARTVRNELLRSSALSERLTEGRQPDNFDAECADKIDDDLMEISQKVLADFDKVLYKTMSEILKDYGAEKTSVKALEEELEDFDAEEMQAIQMECVNDIAAALSKYGRVMCLLASHVKLAGYEPMPPVGAVDEEV